MTREAKAGAKAKALDDRVEVNISEYTVEKIRRAIERSIPIPPRFLYPYGGTDFTDHEGRFWRWDEENRRHVHEGLFTPPGRIGAVTIKAEAKGPPEDLKPESAGPTTGEDYTDKHGRVWVYSWGGHEWVLRGAEGGRVAYNHPSPGEAMDTLRFGPMSDEEFTREFCRRTKGSGDWAVNILNVLGLCEDTLESEGWTRSEWGYWTAPKGDT